MADAGLLDIADFAVQVKVGSKTVNALGLSVQGIVKLWQRFPEAQSVLTGGAVSPNRVMKLIPEAIPAVIVEGTDIASEAVAARLPIETQIDLLEAIIRLTMPSGFGPFVAKLEAMGIPVQAATKDLDSKSPPASKNSRARADTPMPGPTHHAE